MASPIKPLQTVLSGKQTERGSQVLWEQKGLTLEWALIYLTFCSALLDKVKGEVEPYNRRDFILLSRFSSSLDNNYLEKVLEATICSLLEADLLPHSSTCNARRHAAGCGFFCRFSRALHTNNQLEECWSHVSVHSRTILCIAEILTGSLREKVTHNCYFQHVFLQFEAINSIFQIHRQSKNNFGLSFNYSPHQSSQ